MFNKKNEIKSNKNSFTKSMSLNKVEKKIIKKDKKTLSNDEKYLSPVFSTMSGATYSLENC